MVAATGFVVFVLAQEQLVIIFASTRTHYQPDVSHTTESDESCCIDEV